MSAEKPGRLDEDFDEKYYEIGEEYKTEVNDFKSDLSSMIVDVSSIILSFSDGEVENFIGPNTSSPTPMVEFVINNLKLV